jgi:hypothetical protein
LLLHFKKEALSHKVFEVFALKVQEHSFDVAIFALKEDFTIAKTAHRSLRISVNPQYWFFAIWYHACSLEECTVSTQRHN